MSQTANYASFGSGVLIAKTATGVVPFGALQDVNLDIAGKNEELYGQYQAPLLVARATVKYSGKAKTGYVSGPLYSQLFFGVTASTGTTSLAYQEPHSVPAATPWTVTVSNSATFVADFGVTYANTGVQLEPVASGPTQGQYSFAAGVYTFATADASAAVLISYTYTTAAAGSTIIVPNSLQGVQPVFSVILQRSYNGVGERFLLSNCIASKLSLPTAMAKFGISEMDFDAFAPNGGSPLSIYTDT